MTWKETAHIICGNGHGCHHSVDGHTRRDGQIARHENQDISAMNELLTLAADFHAESACKLVSISTCRCCRVANSQRDVTQLIGATNKTNHCPSDRKTIAEFFLIGSDEGDISIF